MKYSRHAKILELIEKYEIDTQEELAEYLKKSGYNVTQATISRDIKELRLIKVLSKSGKYKYATIKQQDNIVSDRLIRVFKGSVLTIDYAENFIVVKTLSGAANAAAATIDAMEIKDIVGTIAGDDTIFILIRDKEKVPELVGYFQNIMRS